jgi:Fe-S cluster biogenesis protein NfuA
MANEPEGKEFRNRMQRLEELIQEIERFPQPDARDHIREILRSLLELHGTGLRIVLEKIAAAGPTGLGIIDSLADNEVVSGLLLLHDLHPLDIDSRVGQALERVRPYLRSHGGNVELLGLTDGVVRLRMQGSCHSCPSSALTLKNAIEEAIYECAPDVAGIEVEGVVEEPKREPSTFVPVEQLHVRRSAVVRETAGVSHEV